MQTWVSGGIRKLGGSGARHEFGLLDFSPDVTALYIDSINYQNGRIRFTTSSNSSVSPSFSGSETGKYIAIGAGGMYGFAYKVSYYDADELTITSGSLGWSGSSNPAANDSVSPGGYLDFAVGGAGSTTRVTSPLYSATVSRTFRYMPGPNATHVRVIVGYVNRYYVFNPDDPGLRLTMDTSADADGASYSVTNRTDRLALLGTVKSVDSTVAAATLVTLGGLWDGWDGDVDDLDGVAWAQCVTGASVPYMRQLDGNNSGVITLSYSSGTPPSEGDRMLITGMGRADPYAGLSILDTGFEAHYDSSAANDNMSRPLKITTNTLNDITIVFPFHIQPHFVAMVDCPLTYI